MAQILSCQIYLLTIMSFHPFITFLDLQNKCNDFWGLEVTIRVKRILFLSFIKTQNLY